MLLEQELEQNLVDAFGALEPLSDGVQIIGSRLGDKTERDDTKTIVAVSSAFRTHDAFSLSPITVRVGISIVTRGELDSTSQRHNEVVEAIVNQLSFWHKDGVSMQNALSSRKLMAGELRIDSGTAQVYDRTNNIWTDTIGFAIRGAERFWTEPTKNRIVWNDWSYTDFDTEIFTSAETLDDYLYGIGRQRDEIAECYVFEEFVGHSVFVGMANLEKVYFDPQVTSFTSELFRNDPKLKEVYFAGRTLHQVECLPYYSWGIDDTSIIRAELETSPKTMFVFPDGSIGMHLIQGELSRSTLVQLGYLTPGTYEWVKMPSRVAFGTAVTSIGYNAFDGCTGLQSIDFAEGLTTIEMYAFTGCTSLASVSLPDTLTTIKSSAFSGNALTEVEIPDSVTTIGSSVFLGCRSLASIDLGSGVETIGSYAFQDCVSLSSITFPSSLSSMGPRAFQGCTSLSDVMFLGKNLNQVAAMNSFNWGITDSRIIRAENQDPRETVFYGLYGTIESYLVEGSLDKNALATIGYWDSANSSWIKHPTYLKIGTAVTSIGEQAFQSCYNLVEVIVPSSVTAIGGYAFRFCGHLQRFVADESLVETLEQSTFEGCVRLEYVSFNGCLLYIRTNAFSNCGSLKGMNFPNVVHLYDGTTEISSDAFLNSGIERVSMPNYCAEGTSSSAFRNCNSLVEFEVRDIRTSEIPWLPNYPWGVTDTSIFHGTI